MAESSKLAVDIGLLLPVYQFTSSYTLLWKKPNSVQSAQWQCQLNRSVCESTSVTPLHHHATVRNRKTMLLLRQLHKVGKRQTICLFRFSVGVQYVISSCISIGWLVDIVTTQRVKLWDGQPTFLTLSEFQTVPEFPILEPFSQCDAGPETKDFATFFSWWSSWSYRI